MNVLDYLASDKHLPDILRDFHDQKDVFKSVHEFATKRGTKPLPADYAGLTWVAAHIYVVDFFLRFMAFHGYTLQKARARVEFGDIRKTIQERRDREAEVFRRVVAGA